MMIFFLNKLFVVEFRIGGGLSDMTMLLLALNDFLRMVTLKDLFQQQHEIHYQISSGLII